tara:strand:- start:677 stop:1129 length:453 start_codon:yes stop_codon:yes gene_type:complete
MNRTSLFQGMIPEVARRNPMPQPQFLYGKVGRTPGDPEPTQRKAFQMKDGGQFPKIKPLQLWGTNDYNTAASVLPCATRVVKVGRTPNPVSSNVIYVTGGQSRSQRNSVQNMTRPLDVPLQAGVWSNSGARFVPWEVAERKAQMKRSGRL